MNICLKPSMITAAALLICPALRAEITAAVVPGSGADQSAAIQASLDAAEAAGGDTVVLPAGLFYAKELALPSNTTLQGQGREATRLSLPGGANTFLIASKCFAENLPAPGTHSAIRDLTLLGNTDNNTSGDLCIVRDHGFEISNCLLRYGAGHGIRLTSFNADGSEPGFGGSVRIFECNIQDCIGAAIYAESDALPLDGVEISDNAVFRNLSTPPAFHAIDFRTATSRDITVQFNQMYKGGLGDLSIVNANSIEVYGNNFDGYYNLPGAGGIVRQVFIEPQGRPGLPARCTVRGNVFHTRATASGAGWHMLSLTGVDATDEVEVTGNVFDADDYLQSTETNAVFDFSDDWNTGNLSGQQGWSGGGNSFLVDAAADHLLISSATGTDWQATVQDTALLGTTNTSAVAIEFRLTCNTASNSGTFFSSGINKSSVNTRDGVEARLIQSPGTNTFKLSIEAWPNGAWTAGNNLDGIDGKRLGFSGTGSETSRNLRLFQSVEHLGGGDWKAYLSLTETDTSTLIAEVSLPFTDPAPSTWSELNKKIRLTNWDMAGQPAGNRVEIHKIETLPKRLAEIHIEGHGTTNVFLAGNIPLAETGE